MSNNLVSKALLSSNCDNTMSINHILNKKRGIGKVIKVIDGDTVDLVLDIKGEIMYMRARLYGIDTPEKKPSLKIEKAERDIIKQAAKSAYEATTKMLLDKVVVYETHEICSFGRLLVTIWIPNTIFKEGDIIDCSNTDSMININEWLISHNHAIPMVL